VSKVSQTKIDLTTILKE